MNVQLTTRIIWPCLDQVSFDIHICDVFFNWNTLTGIRLLNLNPSKFITDDGSISTTSPQRRGLEWPTSQANHAFDRFVTLVKEVKMESTPFGNVD